MSEEAPRPYRRRIVYIYKSYQRRFILQFCLLALAALVIAAVALYLLSEGTLTATYRYHHLALRTTAEAILPALLITIPFVLMGFLAATVFMTLYTSHKVGGPLYRFGKTLEAIGEGDLRQKIRLRRRDQLAEFAEQLNQMTRSLNDRMKQIRDEVDTLNKQAQSADWDKERARDDLQRLRENVSRLFATE